MSQDLDQLFNEVNLIRLEIEEVAIAQRILAQAAGEPLKQRLLEALKRFPQAGQVLLEIDGIRSQEEIRVCLGMAKGSASNCFRMLHEEALITIVPISGRGKIYRRSSIDDILGVSKSIRASQNKAK